MIAVLDYGAGNLRSVANTLAEIGAEYTIVRDAAGLRDAPKIILPGVGHFGQMMRALDELQVRDALIERIRAGVPFLGICLGLQALFESQRRGPRSARPGTVRGRRAALPQRRTPAAHGMEPDRNAARFAPAGWTRLEARLSYFMHSYYVPTMSETAATCTYSLPYTAVLESGNTFAVQFHPEKSGPAGLRLVRNFVELE